MMLLISIVDELEGILKQAKQLASYTIVLLYFFLLGHNGF